MAANGFSDKDSGNAVLNVAGEEGAPPSIVETTPAPIETASEPGLTIEAYAAAKRLSVDALRAFGLETITIGGKPVVKIPYRDEQGGETAVRFRVGLAGSRQFQWRRKSKPMLYGLDRLGAARDQGYVLLVVGESDALTCWQQGVPAVGLPDASYWQGDRDAPRFNGIKRVYVVVEPGQSGRDLTQRLAASSLGDRLALVRLGEFRKVNDLLADDPERFNARLQEALKAAPRVADEEAAERKRIAEESWLLAEPLASAPNLMSLVEQEIRARGYAGDLRPVMIGYLAMSSRVGRKPMNLVYVAPAASGKTRSVEAAAELMPPEAVQKFDAASPLALVYTERDLRRSIVIFSEADSIPNTGAAASVVRTLAEENRLVYEVTEKDGLGGLTTRRIVKPGPICLITTSTKPLAHQLATRMLEVPVRDDEAQTREILLMMAAIAGGEAAPWRDAEPFIALQRWLATQADVTVHIPFLRPLAYTLRAKEARTRRDFNQLISAITAVALLHRAQRPLDAEGRLVATLEDYGYVRDLLVGIFAQVAADGVSPGVRRVVEAVAGSQAEHLSGVPLVSVQRALDVGKTTAYDWVERAVREGYLKDGRVTRTGAMQLHLGEPLPDEYEGLPTVEQLRAAVGSSDGIGALRTPLPPRAFDPDAAIDASLAGEGNGDDDDAADPGW